MLGPLDEADALRLEGPAGLLRPLLEARQRARAVAPAARPRRPLPRSPQASDDGSGRIALTTASAGLAGLVVFCAHVGPVLGREVRLGPQARRSIPWMPSRTPRT